MACDTKNNIMRTALLLLMFFALAACQKTDDAAVVPTPSLALRVFKPFASIHTDKACYKPNEKVVFNLSIDTTAVGTLKIQYLHVGSVVEEKTIALASSDISWEWTPPATDFKAYLVVVVAVNGKDTIRQGTTAVDVSSDWTRFPLVMVFYPHSHHRSMITASKPRWRT